MFSIFLILLSIPDICAILKIMRMCRQSTANATLDNSLLHKEEKFTDFTEVRKEIEVETERETGHNKVDYCIS